MRTRPVLIVPMAALAAMEEAASPVLLHPFQNPWNYFSSSAALRYAPLLGDKLLLQLCLHLQFRQQNKGLHLFKMAAWGPVSEFGLLRKTVLTLAKWILYPNPGDSWCRPATSRVTVERGTGALAGSRGVVNSGAQVGGLNRGDGVRRSSKCVCWCHPGRK